MELERQENVLVIGHQVSLQAILCALLTLLPLVRRFCVVCESADRSAVPSSVPLSMSRCQLRILSQFTPSRSALHQDTIAHCDQVDAKSLWL